MIAETKAVLGAVMIATQIGASTGVQFAGRPTLFDLDRYLSSSKAALASERMEAVIRKIDRHNRTFTVIHRNPKQPSASQTVLTFQLDDRDHFLTHQVGDVIRIQINQRDGVIKVTHSDVP